MAKKDRPVTITCYGKTETWDSRKKARAFYWEGVRCCEGAERDRYMNIVMGIDDGLDEVTDPED